MQLQTVRIKNFRGIEDWEIELKPGFNLIKGENGKGKTSILEAISVGLGGFTANLDGVQTRAFSKKDVRMDSRCTFNCDLNMSKQIITAITNRKIINKE